MIEVESKDPKDIARRFIGTAADHRSIIEGGITLGTRWVLSHKMGYEDKFVLHWQNKENPKAYGEMEFYCRHLKRLATNTEKYDLSIPLGWAVLAVCAPRWARSLSREWNWNITNPVLLSSSLAKLDWFSEVSPALDLMHLSKLNRHNFEEWIKKEEQDEIEFDRLVKKFTNIKNSGELITTKKPLDP